MLQRNPAREIVDESSQRGYCLFYLYADECTGNICGLLCELLPTFTREIGLYCRRVTSTSWEERQLETNR